MRERVLKEAVICTLRQIPDMSSLDGLRRARTPQIRKLLAWLDQSGLALYFFANLRKHRALDQIPRLLRVELEARLKSNQARTRDMLEEFERIVTAFIRKDVRFCALKGFTLCPDFCPTVDLRHQTDFDFFVAPESLPAAKQVLRSFGYSLNTVGQSNDLTFETPLHHIPSAKDDIYAIPRHREVDLVTSSSALLNIDSHGVSFSGDSNCIALHHPQTKNLAGISFPALPVQDAFCVQVLHAFRHLLGSWVRASWLLEISNFINRHFGDDMLWREIAAQVGNDSKMRNAFGVITSLTNALFHSPLPEALSDWCLRPLPPRIESWVAQFGMKTALSGLDGSKLTLFVQREFVDDPASWPAYVRQRLFPVGRQSSVGIPTTGDPGARMTSRVSQWRHSFRRAAFHAGELFSLPVDAIRWKYALHSIDKRRILVSPVQAR